MSSLRVGMPVAGCQVGVARISGQMASPVTDFLYLSAMLPSDFSIVFQPPMVVGQRPRATSPLPTRAYSVRVGRSLTGGCHLPPARVAEVEDFVDFLVLRNADRELVHAAAAASVPAFAKVWDNPEDDVYDET